MHTYAQRWQNVGKPDFPIGPLNFCMDIGKDGIPYLLYDDPVSGLVLKKFDGSNWVLVGSPGFASGEHSTMVIDSDGTPYVTLTYSPPTNNVRIMKFDGVSWVNVGPPGFLTRLDEPVPIKLDKSGTPYVAYMDKVTGLVSVAKFNGSSWITVGNAGFSETVGWNPMLAIDSSGTPYVVFYYDVGNNTTVMKYDGHNWVTVGSPKFAHSDGAVIEVDEKGTPYIAYSDWNYDFKASVMKYNGSSWVYVGSPGFSDMLADDVCLRIDKNGTPYVAYWNDSSGYSGGAAGPAIVMKYDGSKWIHVGNPGFSGGDIAGMSLALDKRGTPYVSFAEGLVTNPAYSSFTEGRVMKLDTTLQPIYLSPITGIDSVCTGASSTLSDTVRGGNWICSDTNIAIIDSNGIITGVSPGTVTIFYSLSGCPSATFTFVVKSCSASKSVFQNPNHGSFTLNIPSRQSEGATIIITNRMGEKVREVKTTTNTDTPIQLDCPSGMYFISVVTTEGMERSKMMLLK